MRDLDAASRENRGFLESYCIEFKTRKQKKLE